VTDDKNFKRLVRARMAETGEAYTEARDALGRGEAASGDGVADPLPRDARIFVTGHRGLVGSALVRRLRAEGYRRILTATRDQLDLRDQAAVSYWFRANRPDYVFLVAGTVGGIMANATRPAEFLYDNMLIHGTVVHSSHEYRVRKLLYLGSSCVVTATTSSPCPPTSTGRTTTSTWRADTWSRCSCGGSTRRGWRASPPSPCGAAASPAAS
jgi:hypothetical protein